MLQGKCYLPTNPRLAHFCSSNWNTLLIRTGMHANEHSVQMGGDRKIINFHSDAQYVKSAC